MTIAPRNTRFGVQDQSILSVFRALESKNIQETLQKQGENRGNLLYVADTSPVKTTEVWVEAAHESNNFADMEIANGEENKEKSSQEDR